MAAEEGSTNYRQMPAEGAAEPGIKTCGKYFCKIIILILLMFCLVAVVIQAFLYWWGSNMCKSGDLTDYSYPGGGSYNLVQSDTLLIEQEPHWWGSSFIVSPADKHGLASGASTGVYFKTWGPIFNTYVYQDDLGKQTFMIRDRPLALGGSHKITRCDGKGPVYVVSEGSHVVMNRIRAMFGMYTSRVYNIYEDNVLVGISEKLGGTGSHKQLMFRDPKKSTPFASSFLADRHYHGMFDQWFVQDEENIPLPAFVPNAATILMAFPAAEAKNKKAKTSAPAQLMELSPAAADDGAGATAEDPEAPATAPESLKLAESKSESLTLAESMSAATAGGEDEVEGDALEAPAVATEKGSLAARAQEEGALAAPAQEEVTSIEQHV